MAFFDKSAILSSAKPLLVATLLIGCNQDSRLPHIEVDPIATETNSLIRLRDVTADSNVKFTYRNGFEAGQFAILQSLGGGCAICDFDADGYADLFFSGGGSFSSDNNPTGHPGALYRNQGHLQFDDVSSDAQVLRNGRYSHAVCTADYNDDGFPDALITGYNGLTLFLNQGDGTFVDITEQASLTDESWSSSAAWGDINGDGALDLYVTHYVDWSPENNPICTAGHVNKRDVCPPRRFKGVTDSLFISKANGSFREAGKENGLVSGGKGLGVIAADIDLDGDLDLYVTNDTEPNFHYIYDRDNGQLVESAALTGTGIGSNGSSEGSMGCDLGDYDSDGLPDIWVANYQRETFSLYRNQSNNVFMPAEHQTGVASLPSLFVGWGTLFADFDLDRDLDVFVTTGHVILYPTESTIPQLPLLLENMAAARFRNVTSETNGYTSESHEGRGLAAGDLNHDGYVDLVVSHLNAPVTILENNSQSTSHWLQIRLVGIESTRNPIGSRITVKAGDKTLARQLKGGTSYASTSDQWLHFGLGAEDTARDVTIWWRSGKVSRIGDIQADQRYVIQESASEPRPRPVLTAK